MAIKLKEIVRDTALYYQPDPETDLINWLQSLFSLTLGDRKVPVVSLNPWPNKSEWRNWLEYAASWATEVIGVSREHAIKYLLSETTIGAYFELSSTSLSSPVPNMLYAQTSPGPTVPLGFSTYRGGGGDRRALGDDSEYVHLFADCITGDPGNGINGVRILETLQGLGYQVDDTTSVRDFKSLIGEDWEAWLTIAVEILAAMDDPDVLNGPDFSNIDCAGDDLFPGLSVYDLPSGAAYQFNDNEQGNGTILFLQIGNPNEGTDKYVVLDLGTTQSLSGGFETAGRVLKCHKNSGVFEKTVLIQSSGTQESLWMKSCSSSTPIALQDEYMTLQEIWDNFPTLQKYLYEDSPAPIGLSATKKHFIRVI